MNVSEIAIACLEEEEEEEEEEESQKYLPSRLHQDVIRGVSTAKQSMLWRVNGSRINNGYATGSNWCPA